jgi:hypothetical protein
MSIYGNNENEFRRINGLEILLLLFAFGSLISIFIYGFLGQSTSIRDSQRIFEITQIAKALDNYYENSSYDTASKFYPVAQCKGEANEVDYEFVLRESLSGRRKEKDDNIYIDFAKFPNDKSGKYSSDLKSAKANKCPNLFTNNNNYYNNGTQGCEYSKDKNPFCYLYSSTNSGDSYTLVYYNENKQAFAKINKFRDQEPSLEYISR